MNSQLRDDSFDVCRKYLFAVLLTNGIADTIARELTSTFVRLTFLPEIYLSGSEISFVSEPMHALTKLFEIQRKYGRSRHPQKVRVVERSHSELKGIHKFKAKEQWNDCFKCFQLATCLHNTSLSFSDWV